MKEGCLITMSNGGGVFMYRKSMCVHGASQGNSETERVAPTQIPSPKFSELIAFLVAGAKHLTESNFWKKGFILAFFFWRVRSVHFSRKGRIAGAGGSGSQHSCSREKRRGLLAFCSLLSPSVSARIPASVRCSVPMAWVLLQLILPENTLAGVPGGAMSEWF